MGAKSTGAASEDQNRLVRPKWLSTVEDASFQMAKVHDVICRRSRIQVCKIGKQGNYRPTRGKRFASSSPIDIIDDKSSRHPTERPFLVF